MVRLNRIYTRTGDDGTTGLVDGSRVAKDDARIEAVGAIDELNSAIGLARAQLNPESPVGAALARIQNDLFDLGADLATPGDDFAPSDSALRIVPAQTGWLEAQIDRLNEGLAPLRSFILPAGPPPVAALHLARAIARRAERAIVRLQRSAPVNPQALAYCNRLSDYLFVACRALAFDAGGETLWVPGASR